MGRQRHTFPHEFEREAANLVFDQGYHAEPAQLLGLEKSALPLGYPAPAETRWCHTHQRSADT